LAAGAATMNMSSNTGSNGRSTTVPVFDRSLIISPMLRLGPSDTYPLVDTVLSTLNSIPVLRDHVFDVWGPGCEKERANGRGGFCEFNAAIAAAARDFGLSVLSFVGAEGGHQQKNIVSARMNQVAYDLHDPSISTQLVDQYFEALPQRTDVSKSKCVLPSALGHSCLSPHDDFADDKWWLNEMSCRVASYLTQQGTPVFGQGLPVGFLPQDPVVPGSCLISCNTTSCSWHYNQKLSCPVHIPMQQTSNKN